MCLVYKVPLYVFENQVPVRSRMDSLNYILDCGHHTSRHLALIANTDDSVDTLALVLSTVNTCLSVSVPLSLPSHQFNTSVLLLSFSLPEANTTTPSDPRGVEAGKGKECVAKEEELYSQYFSFWPAKNPPRFFQKKTEVMGQRAKVGQQVSKIIRTALINVHCLSQHSTSHVQDWDSSVTANLRASIHDEHGEWCGLSVCRHKRVRGSMRWGTHRQSFFSSLIPSAAVLSVTFVWALKLQEQALNVTHHTEVLEFSI